jgi:hypothetical protein
MTIGTSLFLIAVGAILKFAVTATVGGVNIQTAGVVLMVVGAVGLIVGLGFLLNRRGTVVAPGDRVYPADRGYGPPPEV